MNREDEKRVQVRCPKCGYRMPVYYTEIASCRGVFVTCKGRNCKTRFEVIIQNGSQAGAGAIETRMLEHQPR